MTTVVQIPPSLDDRTFEQVLDKVAKLGEDEKVLLDARHSRWASPYGLTALLTLAQARPERMGFAVQDPPPQAHDYRCEGELFMARPVST